MNSIEVKRDQPKDVSLKGTACWAVGSALLHAMVGVFVLGPVIVQLAGHGL